MSGLDLLKFPNSNAEAYREMQVFPNITEPYLQAICVLPGEDVVVASSSMTNRIWNGALKYYTKKEPFDESSMIASWINESGVCDCASLNNGKMFVAGEDNGSLQIFELVEAKGYSDQLQSEGKSATPSLQSKHYTCQHDDGIKSISVSAGSKNIITGGMDNSVRVWDTNGLIMTSTYSPAHSDIVACVHSKPTDESVFASASLDGEALIWDIRNEKPATKLYERNRIGLTAVSWNPHNDNEIVIGAEDGSLTLLDQRQLNGDSLSSAILFSRGVHRLLFNPLVPGQLAGCSDTTTVNVFSYNNQVFSSIYEDTRHEHFVRGLAWRKNSLLTCSWDGKVLEHQNFM